MTVNTIERYGNLLKIIFSDASTVFAYPSGGSYFYPSSNSDNINNIRLDGNLIELNYISGSKVIGYGANDIWHISGVATSSIIDNILPGHSITNPGGTIASGWQWHIDNTTTDGGITGRGGDDLNYSYGTNFLAPANGTVSHFDLSGVGMITILKLDVPVVRTNPTLYVSEAAGPMKAIWFEHNSASYDGHHSQGDVIGKSGDGYGGYSAHLHVHGLVDTGSSAGTSNRCCFWSFL